MSRGQYPTRSILLRAESQRDLAIAALTNAPLDPDKPVQVVIREEVKARKPDQNSLMWVGPLADIAEQGWLSGRQYAAEVWHEYFKRNFLPEEFDPVLCKEGYAKWAYDPAGERVLIGSTTQLTVKGFAQYLTRIEAFAANLGVRLHASPNERPV